MNINELNEKRAAAGLTYKDVSELSGVPLSTVQKVLGGITESPSYATMNAIESVIQEHFDGYVAEPAYAYQTDSSAEIVKDADPLPVEKRVERIYGAVYDLAAPSAEHQLIATEIINIFKNYIKKNKGQCIPMIAPFDVHILNDDDNVVQPDVMIFCNKDKLKKENAQGTPDLIVEIVSPSSGSHDKIRKLALYYDAKVREYWIVDPITNEILVYRYQDGDYVLSRYTFSDKVPVGIYNGECIVDFGEISDYIKAVLG